jgi:hypothetical protein
MTPSCHRAWQAEIPARLFPGDAGARITNPVTLFGTLQSNLSLLDFSLLLLDVMTIADEVDAQLTQTMDSYMNAMRKAAAA